ncbi:hypothetical protein F4776DRAFT_263058 [Hypoxylon sp. NC0597]|nr:hypothetical protein F4776DRAFT_263058 [Hypoxylon sp. NC0597]
MRCVELMFFFTLVINPGPVPVLTYHPTDGNKINSVFFQLPKNNKAVVRHCKKILHADGLGRSFPEMARGSWPLRHHSIGNATRNNLLSARTRFVTNLLADGTVRYLNLKQKL